MDASQRDLAILDLVNRFHQATTANIQQIIFDTSKSATSANRVLRRLVETRMLARIERKIVGGAHGGSGMYVYQLGLEGHKLFNDGRYVPGRAVNYHSLAILGCFETLVRLERAGMLELRGYMTEPDCHQTIGRFELKPDLYAEYQRPGGAVGRLMFEIDMASQGQRQIMGKFQRFWGAFTASEGEQWPENQVVLFVAVDDQRAKELRWLRERLEPEQQGLFKVTTGADLYTALSR